MTLETERPWWRDRADQIEREVGAGYMDAARCYTQMRQLLDATRRAALEAKQTEVKLPEPVAKIEGGSMKWCIPNDSYGVKITLLQGTHHLYTEPQVRALLAQHGIKCA